MPILGTQYDSMDLAEDRERFDGLLNDLNIPKPPGRAVTTVEAAVQVANEIGYPTLVRPSYVLGGRAMEIVFNEEDLRSYMQTAVDVSPARPILVDKYIIGKEAEVDVIADGQDCLLPGIMEHIERAGVHSGDSMAVYPPQTLSPNIIRQIEEYAIKIARALKIVGLMNIQYVIEGEQAYIIEVNPRASRTVPYLSKITGIPMVPVATQVMLGKTLKELGYSTGLYPEPDQVAVKAPVFSFQKLTMVDIGLGPEMKSTGEVMGVDNQFPRALYKAMIASGYDIPFPGKTDAEGELIGHGALLVTLADHDKEEGAPLVKGFADLGYKIFATQGTAGVLREHGVESEVVEKIHEDEPNLMTLITEPSIDFILNTPERDRTPERDGLKIRRAAVEQGVPCLTSLDTAQALLTALTYRKQQRVVGVRAVGDYILPGPQQQESCMRHAIILFSHGSLLCGAGETLRQLAERMQARGDADWVRVGYLNYSEPAFEDTFARCVQDGATRITIAPVLFGRRLFCQTAATAQNRGDAGAVSRCGNSRGAGDVPPRAVGRGVDFFRAPPTSAGAVATDSKNGAAVLPR